MPTFGGSLQHQYVSHVDMRVCQDSNEDWVHHVMVIAGGPFCTGLSQAEHGILCNNLDGA
jgi:hypothetical protein